MSVSAAVAKAMHGFEVEAGENPVAIVVSDAKYALLMAELEATAKERYSVFGGSAGIRIDGVRVLPASGLGE